LTYLPKNTIKKPRFFELKPVAFTGRKSITYFFYNFKLQMELERKKWGNLTGIFEKIEGGKF